MSHFLESKGPLLRNTLQEVEAEVCEEVAFLKASSTPTPFLPTVMITCLAGQRAAGLRLNCTPPEFLTQRVYTQSHSPMRRKSTRPCTAKASCTTSRGCPWVRNTLAPSSSSQGKLFDSFKLHEHALQGCRKIVADCLPSQCWSCLFRAKNGEVYKSYFSRSIPEGKLAST